MVCGPKCSGCLFAFSLWGIIFLGILGGLFYHESVGLLEDIPKEASGWNAKTWDQRVKDIKDLYHQNAYNCWIAAGVNGVILVASAVRMFTL